MGARPSRIGGAPWTSFTATRAYTVSGGPHLFWTALGAQYRDDQSNVSPLYCAEIQGICLGTPTPMHTPIPPPTSTPDGSTVDRIYLPIAHAAVLQPRSHNIRAHFCRFAFGGTAGHARVIAEAHERETVAIANVDELLTAQGD